MGAEAGAQGVGDWRASDLSVDLGGGFALADFEGDAPVLCLAGPAVGSGIVELSSFPIASLDAVRAARAGGPRAALEAHVGEMGPPA